MDWAGLCRKERQKFAFFYRAGFPLPAFARTSWRGEYCHPRENGGLVHLLDSRFRGNDRAFVKTSLRRIEFCGLYRIFLRVNGAKSLQIPNLFCISYKK